ncbi:PREDICTED: putative F-box/LRR-repeat protein At5g02700 [Nicotiana attenuata]|uniref:putative F-box/LRR-repeat protein At5g02700 n=1 Tax=Nicotiana attenuata TaxID=49451 RepID=UPI000905C1A5|nr:PREDICTED: putative F-box/LRR-repeat protein At5g02700 [Nicotiana attenuata]
MMKNTFKGLEDGRDKFDRLTDLPINIIHQIQEHKTIEDAARMSVLSSKWRHVWASNPKLRISADFRRKTNQTGTIDIINRSLLQHYGPIKTFLLDISMINPSEHSVIDLWMLHLSRNGLVELTLRSLEYLNAPYKLPSCVYAVELEHLNLSYCTLRPPCSFGGLAIMMTNTFKGLEDGRDKFNRLTDPPINIIHQIQEHTIEDAARMSVLSSKWRHVWASNPKLRISADFRRKTNQTGAIDIINRSLLQHYGPIKTFLLDISMINPSEHSVIDPWMLHLSGNGLVELTLWSLEYLNAPYKLPSCVYAVELEHLNLSYYTFRPPCSFGGFHKLKNLKLDGVAFELDVATSFLFVPNLLELML